MEVSVEDVEPEARRRPPIVLIVDDQEWSARSLESILAPNGFAVMRAYTGVKGLERARANPPDAVIVDADLPDQRGYELCAALRREPTLGERVALLISCTERPSHTQRLEAFRAGAWDIITFPVDAEELVLKLACYTRAKLAADTLSDTSLVDPNTGLYNLRGLERRAEELSASAFRDRGALACVVLAPAVDADLSDGQVAQVVSAIAAGLRAAGRKSDAVGRLGKTEFAILAPSTDGEGAVRMANRLSTAIRLEPGAAGADLRAGYDAVPNIRETPMSAKDLLVHATLALRQSRAGGNGGSSVRAFGPRGAN
jgi:diguanylate cyclase (GGDEF)-like protein